jgi:hypothetical protein
MNIRRVSTQVLLFFFMLMLLIVTVGCSKSDDDAVPGTTYGISGVVSLTGGPLSGVTVTLSGRLTGTYTTGADGKYSFKGLPKGSYNLTPILAGYMFNPASKVVVITGSNMNADFVATSFTGATYNISGKVTGVEVFGVKIRFTSASTRAEVLTNGDGTYTSPSFPAGGPYTVTPYNSGFAFTPANISPITLTSANSTGNNFASESSAFTQADLEGTWEMHALETGTASGWNRVAVTIDSTGTLSFNGYVDSSGGSVPAGTVVWTIDPFTGVITESGTGGNPDCHYSMASNKNFIAGTQRSIGTTHPALLIAQKKVDGTVYSNDDVRNKNFVFHQLNVGLSKTWQYGAGSINGTGAVNITIKTDAVAGTSNPGDTGSIISVGNDGVVTMTGIGMATYHGFLSDDKRTIVGTATSDTGVYSLMIIQIINGECNCYISNIAGISYGHMLTTGAYPAPFWVDQKISITGGVMSFISWLSSNPAVTAPTGTQNISISSSKTATITGSNFNGQLSYDEKFMVGTETFDTGVFALDVFTY